MNFADAISLAMRIITNWREIEKLIPRMMEAFNTIQDAQRLLIQILPMAAQTARIAPQGFDVRWLQSSLNTLIGAGLAVDGDYGTNTKAAVTKFQRQNGLTPDGWAGAVTEAKILELLSSNVVELRH